MGTGSQKYKLPVVKQIIHEDAMNSMASVLNNTISYI